MTYIYPNYRVVRTQPDSMFSKKYSLYLYREGHYDSEHLIGSPVLFIPGQAGSYKQVRSFASETSKYSFSKKNLVSMQDIDWFTLDLNEELTAFSGQQIIDQAAFTNAAIQTILSLYKGRISSVILVGHSMGGIVARAALMQPNYTPHSVQTIFTFATPHQNAPISLDPALDRIYRDLSLYWQPSQFRTGALQNLVLVSVSGGSLDTIIHSDSTGLHGIAPESHSLDTFTTSIPSVWTGSDHMAILWCNQLAKIVARTLVDLSSSPQSVQNRMDLIKKNLMDHLQLLTNMEEKYDSLWQLGACQENGSCRVLQPTVSLIPTQKKAFRLISVVDSSTKYIGLLENSAPVRPFLILHKQLPQYHSLSTWGNN
ncbi:PGAP1-like protein-domain-containing protein [Sporodiniella umbellata]|nr:PGAP1-like protein-domain-containing protein [Sporodiniella umbellata]